MPFKDYIALQSISQIQRSVLQGKELATEINLVYTEFDSLRDKLCLRLVL